MNTKPSEHTQNLLLNAIFSGSFSEQDLSADMERVALQFAQAQSPDCAIQKRQELFVDTLAWYLELAQETVNPKLLAWAMNKLPTLPPQSQTERVDSILRILKIARLQLVEADKISRHDVRFFDLVSKSGWTPKNRAKQEANNIESAVASFPSELAFALLDSFQLSLQDENQALTLSGTDTVKAVQLMMGRQLHVFNTSVVPESLDRTKSIVQKLLHHLVSKAFDNCPLEKECIELQHQVQAVQVILAQRKQFKIDALADQLKTIQGEAFSSKVIVCLEPIPPGADRTDQDVLKRYERLRSPIALQPLPSLRQLEILELTLKQEFPWAHLTVDAIAEELRTRVLAGGCDLYMTPKVLFGAAGSGKNRFARRLAELLQQPFSSIALGGHGDVKAISGTARGWASGQPCPIVELMMTRNCANPMVLLDEVDKINSHHNAHTPPIASILLQFLERENATRYRDLFLQTPCDLSHVIYIATSNALETLPLPLLSRMQVLPMPSPQPEHFEQIFQNVLRDEAIQLGLPESYFEHFEMDKSGNLEACKNIRDIQRLVKGMSNAWIHTTRCKDKLH